MVIRETLAHLLRALAARLEFREERSRKSPPPRGRRDMARIAAYRRWFAAHPGPSVDQIQRAHDRAARRAARADHARILRQIARHGVAFPGDDA